MPLLPPFALAVDAADDERESGGGGKLVPARSGVGASKGTMTSSGPVSAKGLMTTLGISRARSSCRRVVDILDMLSMLLRSMAAAMSLSTVSAVGAGFVVWVRGPDRLAAWRGAMLDTNAVDGETCESDTDAGEMELGVRSEKEWDEVWEVSVGVGERDDAEAEAEPVVDELAEWEMGKV